MAAEAEQNQLYAGRYVKCFQDCLKHSRQHELVLHELEKSCQRNLKELVRGKAKWMFSVLEVVEGRWTSRSSLSCSLHCLLSPSLLTLWNPAPRSQDNFKPLVGWGILWKTYKKVFSNKNYEILIEEEEIIFHLSSLGLKHKKHILPFSFDITDCFQEGNEMGEVLPDFLTDQVNFHQSLTAELRAGILDLLRNKCSIEKDGRVLFNNDMCCIIVDA
ncbi:hypothetical protein LDENG_00103570 [Lucifuga dentata]|nr:hypothetical protein LDENG_00103570 [Lucifuga dentata]